jgi:hypothetical protein
LSNGYRNHFLTLLPVPPPSCMYLTYRTSHPVDHISHRPLPDERPRQSVANLIGRFEQNNTKRDSPRPSAPLPLRLPTPPADIPPADIPPVPPVPPVVQQVPSPQTPISKPSPALKTPQKPSIKPPAKPSPAQPVKPQHTGQSTISTPTLRHAKTTSKNIHPSPPSSSKTPSTATRPKTPSTVRSKTPSGLFAPTAASLAKARNAEPHPPAPTKKATLSSSAAERLSKPTAASMSKARTPSSLPASPARTRTAASSATTRSATPAKSKIKSSQAKTSQEKENTSVVPTLVATDSPNKNGLGVHSAGSTDPGDLAEHADENREAEEPSYETEEVGDIGERPKEIRTSSPRGSFEPSATQEHQPQSALGHVPSPYSLLDSHPEHNADEFPSRANVGDDIEDIVNLLEGTKIDPPSVASVSDDDVREIPDED